MSENELLFFYLTSKIDFIVELLSFDRGHHSGWFKVLVTACNCVVIWLLSILSIIFFCYRQPLEDETISRTLRKKRVNYQIASQVRKINKTKLPFQNALWDNETQVSGRFMIVFIYKEFSCTIWDSLGFLYTHQSSHKAGDSKYRKIYIRITLNLDLQSDDITESIWVIIVRLVNIIDYSTGFYHRIKSMAVHLDLWLPNPIHW